MAETGNVQNTRQRKWTDEQVQLLRNHYPDIGRKATAELLGRTEDQVRTKASELGLKLNRQSEFWRDFQARAAASKVGKKRPEQAKVILKAHADGKLLHTPERRAASSEAQRKRIAENGHPRGSLGMRHSQETKDTLRQSSLKAWQNMTPEQKRARQAKILRTRLESGVAPKSKRGTWKSEWRDIGGKRVFCRSRWEANYARYLEHRKSDGLIIGWEIEPRGFLFPADLFGETAYFPDFKVTLPSGDIEFHEVKGWMDGRSKANLAKMRTHYPDVKLYVIGAKEYYAIEKKVSLSIDGWEHKSDH